MERLSSASQSDMILIATFYSHFGAVHFKRYCGTRGWEAKLMPVPRQLSSSCGTCVRFRIAEAAVDDEAWLPFSDFPEMEQLAVPEGEEYRQRWHADSIPRD